MASIAAVDDTCPITVVGWFKDASSSCSLVHDAIPASTSIADLSSSLCCEGNGESVRRFTIKSYPQLVDAVRTLFATDLGGRMPRLIVSAVRDPSGNIVPRNKEPLIIDSAAAFARAVAMTAEPTLLVEVSASFLLDHDALRALVEKEVYRVLQTDNFLEALSSRVSEHILRSKASARTVKHASSTTKSRRKRSSSRSAERNPAKKSERRSQERKKKESTVPPRYEQQNSCGVAVDGTPAIKGEIEQKQADRQLQDSLAEREITSSSSTGSSGVMEHLRSSVVRTIHDVFGNEDSATADKHRATSNSPPIAIPQQQQRKQHMEQRKDSETEQQSDLAAERPACANNVLIGAGAGSEFVVVDEENIDREEDLETENEQSRSNQSQQVSPGTSPFKSLVSMFGRLRDELTAPNPPVDSGSREQDAIVSRLQEMGFTDEEAIKRVSSFHLRYDEGIEDIVEELLVRQREEAHQPIFEADTADAADAVNGHGKTDNID